MLDILKKNLILKRKQTSNFNLAFTFIHRKAIVVCYECVVAFILKAFKFYLMIKNKFFILVGWLVFMAEVVSLIFSKQCSVMI